MIVTVKTFASLRAAMDPKFSLKLPDRSTIRDLLNLVLARYKEAKRFLVDAKTKDFHSYYVILKNGRNIVFLNGLGTVLEKGDEVSIFPPMGGG